MYYNYINKSLIAMYA